MILSDPRFQTEIKLTISFHDVDPTGMVWHGNYFRYMEIAREQLLNQFNYSYREMKESGYLWPIVDAKIKYRSPLLYEQRVRVRAAIEEYENRLRIGYQFFDDASGRKTSSAYTIQVAVETKTNELCFVSPAILFERMGITP